MLSKRHNAFFGRLFGQTFATVTTQAVAARKKGTADAATIRVQNPTDCATMRVEGTAKLHVYPAPTTTDPGGFIYVNSNCGTNTSDEQCDNLEGALRIDGTTADLWAPKTNVVGSCRSL